MGQRGYMIQYYQLALIDIDWLLCVAAAWFEWYSHSFLLWYSNVALYLAQCNRKFQGHNQVSICMISVRIHVTPSFHIWTSMTLMWLYCTTGMPSPRCPSSLRLFSFSTLAWMHWI
jgi:hypothetical protein